MSLKEQDQQDIISFSNSMCKTLLHIGQLYIKSNIYSNNSALQASSLLIGFLSDHLSKFEFNYIPGEHTLELIVKWNNWFRNSVISLNEDEENLITYCDMCIIFNKDKIKKWIE